MTAAEYRAAQENGRLTHYPIGEQPNPGYPLGSPNASAHVTREQIIQIEKFDRPWPTAQWEIATFLFGRIVWERVEHASCLKNAGRHAMVTVLDQRQMIDVTFYGAAVTILFHLTAIVPDRRLPLPGLLLPGEGGYL